MEKELVERPAGIIQRILRIPNFLDTYIVANRWPRGRRLLREPLIDIDGLICRRFALRFRRARHLSRRR